MKRIAWAASVGLVVMSIGCSSAESGGQEPIGASSARIIDGTIDDGDHAAIGLAVNFFNQVFGHCSGTLIAPNLVLTARRVG